MTIELMPVGVTCNLSCGYCYQNPLRDAGNFSPGAFDVPAMLKGLEAEGGQFTVFGGEPLLTPLDVLEEIWTFGLEKYGHNGIQTNGALITEETIASFKRFKVSVGISVDGPEELNRSRWAGTIEKTDLQTERSMWAIEELCRQGMAPSIIITLYKGNAAPEVRTRLKKWIVDLEKMGVRYMRLHTLEVDHKLVAQEWAIPVDDQIDVLLDMAAFEATSLQHIRFDIFRDEHRLLEGDDGNVTCIWNACDPWTTIAVRGVDAHGNRVNCGRTEKEGVGFSKAETPGFERYLGLYSTPFDLGGCGGCRFWLMCKGQCPGTGGGGDWRNKTDQCPVIIETMTRFERDLIRDGKTPISLHPQRERLERIAFDGWSAGKNYRIGELLKMLDGKPGRPESVGHVEHGDHTDDANPTHLDGIEGGHGDSAAVHGDSDLHGDDVEHGDSNVPWHADETIHGDRNEVTHGDDGDGHGDSNHQDHADMSSTHADDTEHTHGDHDDHGDSGLPSREEPATMPVGRPRP